MKYNPYSGGQTASPEESKRIQHALATGTAITNPQAEKTTAAIIARYLEKYPCSASAPKK
jgi:hypothetical protein